ncbi:MULTISPECIES: MBL fold metallo-hydrolase [Xanthomonas]|uniref:MBL fold metallo-hydrolase n=1 Tax=Xanthomonas TaxID=338 RepID=UPI001EDEA0EB|nr:MULTISPECIES: MBL fold metallo-hydrolase [Xanthomonas]
MHMPPTPIQAHSYVNFRLLENTVASFQKERTMTTRRDLIKTIAVAGIASAVPAVNTAMAAQAPLKLQHFPAGENGFFRAPVLISGARDAVLIDGGFTLPDGKALADAIKAGGKTLTTIYVSQSDPDYYFSLGPIKAAFPDARIIAASATVAAIKRSVEKKLATWGPQLKENGPQTLADIVMPDAFDGNAITLEGQSIAIVDADGLANRRYLALKSLDAIFGGVLVFSGVHVWTADTPSAEGRKAWIKTLDAMAARKPALVIPGHMAPGAATEVSAIHYTRDYLLAFGEELGKASNSAALIEAMTKRYPGAGMGTALQIGAKVAKGEMKWG